MSDNTGIAAERLLNIVERIENLEAEKKALADDVKDIYAEAKGAGFEPKVIRRIIARRKKDQAEVEELDNLEDLYLQALGMY